jgi:hypothetical protein
MNGELRSRGREWRQRLLALRDALGELYAAEATALSRDLERWGRGFLVALLLAGSALVLGFWLLALLVASLVAVLAIWLPVWGAMLVTFGSLLLVVAGLGLLAWVRLRRLGGPIALVGRRWRDHVAWWQERVLQEADAEREPWRGEHDDGSGR